MSPTSFAGFPGQMYTNDGDFNDFVYFITGIDCQGAGQQCDTGLLGVCAAGLTDCAVGGTPPCQPQAKPSAEVCDGLDNDCNGAVDDGVGLCGADEVCDHGKCVCAGPCDGVTCPKSQVCWPGLA